VWQIGVLIVVDWPLFYHSNRKSNPIIVINVTYFLRVWLEFVGRGVSLAVNVNEENFLPCLAKPAERKMAVVLLPTPPFWEAMALTFMI
jgi:hypothetical protein